MGRLLRARTSKQPLGTSISWMGCLALQEGAERWLPECVHTPYRQQRQREQLLLNRNAAPSPWEHKALCTTGIIA